MNKTQKGIGIALGTAIALTITVIAGKKVTGGKYSTKWFNSLSDDELDIEREKVRQLLLKGQDVYNLLRRFDNVIRYRKYGDTQPGTVDFHREHGWYLPNDD